MNLKTFYKVALILLLATTSTSEFVLADGSAACQEKVTLIYIHGVDEPEIEVFDKETAGLQKYFANKRIGKYIITQDYKKVFWGDLPINDNASKLHASGLIAMNMDHNVWKVKNTTEPKISLLINPLDRILLIGDMGSKSNAVFFRNFINNYIYQLVWTADDMVHATKVFNIIEKQIKDINGKYILVGHSLGSAIAVRFIMDRIIPENIDNGNEKYLSDNFVGLLTSGDVNNTFQAVRWSKELETQEYEQNKNNFVRYFIDNDKFWISYNHRNDLFATKLPPELSSHNNEGKGFIISKTKKAYPFEGLISTMMFWDKSNGMFLSHLYMLDKPKSYVTNVLKIYNESAQKKNFNCLRKSEKTKERNHLSHSQA